MRVLIVASLLVLVTQSSAEEPKLNPHAQDLLEAISGKEKRPAGEVFKNVQLLKNVSAGNLLRLMDNVYSRPLGVTCEHCHVEDRWEADEKRPKRAAREMILLVQDINSKLEQMAEIDNTEPAVTCMTCHRGYLKPALQMK